MIALYIKLRAHASVSPLYRTYIVKKRFARYAYIRNRCPLSVTKEKRVMSLTLIFKRCQKLSPGQLSSKGWIPAGSLKKHFERGLFGIFPSPKKKERQIRSYIKAVSKTVPRTVFLQGVPLSVTKEKRVTSLTLFSLVTPRGFEPLLQP